MKKRLWNLGMKCPNLQEEIEFNRKMGHEIVVERETVQIGGEPQDQALVRVGDKYLVLAEKWGLEKSLHQELPYGATHMSYSVDDVDAAIKTALDAGATLLHGPDEIEGGFGRRRVACFRSPGGLVFCLFQVIENRVPEV
jgi:Glyoxalase-like domain